MQSLRCDCFSVVVIKPDPVVECPEDLDNRELWKSPDSCDPTVFMERRYVVISRVCLCVCVCVLLSVCLRVMKRNVKRTILKRRKAAQATTTLCLKKNDTDVTHYRFNSHRPISVIFGRDVAERVCY